MNDEKLTALEREKRGLEEMLFLVLESIGEPVIVTKEQMVRGAGPDRMIRIDDDIARDCFVFSVEEVPDGFED